MSKLKQYNGNTTNNKGIGERIKQLRKEVSLTLEEICKITNLPKSTLNSVELGRRVPSLDIISTVANFFSVDITYIITGHGHFIMDDGTQLSDSQYFELKQKKNAIRLIVGSRKVERMTLFKTDEAHSKYVIEEIDKILYRLGNSDLSLVLKIIERLEKR